MKKIFCAILSMAFIAILPSCNKNAEHAGKQIVIDTTLAGGADYFLNLQQYGDADDLANIVKQATSYSTSEIINTPDVFAPVYHYSSIAKTSLTDQVVISITEGNHGNSDSRRHSDSTTITIHFVIN